jgi:hypothetical protein
MSNQAAHITAFPALIHGTRRAMRGCMLGLGRLWRIRRASGGGGFGMGARASRINLSLAMTAAALPPRFTLRGGGVACWSIPPTATHGALLG